MVSAKMNQEDTSVLVSRDTQVPSVMKVRHQKL